MAAGDANAVTEGAALTVTVTLAVDEQPAADVPVTVYTVVDVGETFTDVPVKFPGIQEYADAPEPVSVLLCPVQIAAGEAVAPTTGMGLTVTVTVEVPLHPAADKPITVYTVVAVGQTLTVVPARVPGIQE